VDRPALFLQVYCISLNVASVRTHNTNFYSFFGGGSKREKKLIKSNGDETKTRCSWEGPPPPISPPQSPLRSSCTSAYHEMKASMKRADRRRWVDVAVRSQSALLLACCVCVCVCVCVRARVLDPAWLRYPCSPSNSSHLPTAAESESKKETSRPRRLSLNFNNFSGYASLNTYAELVKHTHTHTQTLSHTHTHTHTHRLSHTHTHTHRQTNLAVTWINHLTGGHFPSTSPHEASINRNKRMSLYSFAKLHTSLSLQMIL